MNEMKRKLTIALAGWILLCLSLCVYGYLFNNRQKNLDVGFAEEMHIVRQNIKKGEKTNITLAEEEGCSRLGNPVIDRMWA